MEYILWFIGGLIGATWIFYLDIRERGDRDYYYNFKVWHIFAFLFLSLFGYIPLTIAAITAFFSNKIWTKTLFQIRTK